jgi:hypothetical protein
MDINISQLETHGLAVHKPRKTDDSLLGKITYNEQDLILYLDNVFITEHKKIKHKDSYYSILVLKANKRICKKLIEFDQQCITHVKQNVGGWFTKLLDENVIEEYYTSSVSLDQNGFIIKLKIQSSDTILLKGKYDLKLMAKGLRFYKQRFIVEWDIAEYKQLDIDFINGFEDDISETWELSDTDDITPSCDDLDEIYNNLFNILKSKSDKINNNIATAQHQLDIINNYLETLKSNKYNIKELEHINDVIDNLEF